MLRRVSACLVQRANTTYLQVLAQHIVQDNYGLVTDLPSAGLVVAQEPATAWGVVLDQNSFAQTKGRQQRERRLELCRIRRC